MCRAIVACICVLVAARSASAGTCFWSGGGADAKWSTRANWTCTDGVVPQNGDSVVFQPGPLSGRSENDIAGLTLDRITLDGTANSDPWRVTGLGVRLSTALFVSESASFLAPVTLAGDVTIERTGPRPLAGELRLGPIDLNGFALAFQGDSGIIVEGAVSGNGTVLKRGNAPLTLSDGTYAGPTTCTDGQLTVTGAHALGAAGPGNETTITGTCLLVVAASATFDEALTLDSDLGRNGDTPTIAEKPVVRVGAGINAVLAGAIVQGAAKMTFDLAAGSQVVVTGAVSKTADFPVVKLGGGTLALSNPANQFSELRLVQGVVRTDAAGAIPGSALVFLAADGTFDLNNTNQSIGSLGGQERSRVLLGSGTLTFRPDPAAGTSIFSGTIAGSGGVVKRGSGTTLLFGSAPNTYTGATIVEDGRLGVLKDEGVVAMSGPIVVNGGTFEASGDCLPHGETVTVNPFGVFKAKDVIVGDLAGSGLVIVETQIKIGATNTASTFSGAISSDVFVTKVGTSALTLTGPSVIGALEVESGTLIVNGNVGSHGRVSLDEDAVFGGVGRVGTLIRTFPRGNARVTPGPVAGPGAGILHVREALFDAITLAVELNGPSAGSGHDQLEVSNGNLVLTSTSTLEITRGFTPRAGQTFTIVALASTFVTRGTFAGLPEGATFLVSGQQFQITYRGGDGNDVVLTALDGPTGFSYYLAEGATSPVFDTELALLNPGDADTTAHVAFLRRELGVAALDVAVPAHRRVTLDPKTVLGAGTVEFSTTVESPHPLVVDRTMHWAHGEAYGAHAETAVSAPALTWYLAEGATHSGLYLFYLLQNPNLDPAEVRVRYLRPEGGPLAKTYTLPPQSRTTIWVNVEDFPGQGLVLASTDVSAVVEVLNDQPIIVERSLYASVPGQVLGAGHDSVGVTTPATEWFLAEGATGSFMDLFVLIANPSDAAAQIEATFLLPDGTSVAKAYTVAANSRFTVWVDYDDARLADTAVSTRVRSTNGVPVIVERAMWWPDGAWYEGHNSSGATTTGAAWGLAAGALDAARGLETYILVANPSDATATVKVTLYFEDGAPVERTFEILPRSRFNVAVASEFPQAAGRRFGAVVESLGATPTPIVVERSMYWDAVGQVWAAGTNALAVKLP